MTDRIRTLKVILDKDMRDDDVETVKQAIKVIRAVADVQNGEAVGSDEHMNRRIALMEFLDLQYRLLRLVGPGSGGEAEDRLKRIKEILGATS